MSTPILVGAPPLQYAGLATRAVGLAVDAAIAQFIVFAGGAVLALVASLVGGDQEFGTIERFLAAVAWAVVFGFYFVLFWSTTGQTPGMRLMGLRVLGPNDVHPGLARSFVRLAGLVICIIPLFAGFLPVLVDDRRRGVLDMLAGTVVVYVEDTART
jgi:uncharacterized RDD family membrane protein YckC